LLTTSMVANDDTLNTSFSGFFGIRNRLDSFQNDGTIPVLLKEFDVIPCMTVAWKYNTGPFSGRVSNSAAFNVDHVVFGGVVDFVAVLFLEMGLEDGIGEADFHADAVGVYEGIIALLDISDSLHMLL